MGKVELKEGIYWVGAKYKPDAETFSKCKELIDEITKRIGE